MIILSVNHNSPFKNYGLIRVSGLKVGCPQYKHNNS